MERNPYRPPQTPVTDADGPEGEKPASRLRKVIVSILWIAIMNVAFVESYVTYIVNFDPTLSQSNPYEFGQTYGVYFFVSSVALVVSLAVVNRLPGARKQRASN